MIPGTKLTINMVLYTVDKFGPRTTLLIRGDGVCVHVDTASLIYLVRGAA